MQLKKLINKLKHNKYLMIGLGVIAVFAVLYFIANTEKNINYSNSIAAKDLVIEKTDPIDGEFNIPINIEVSLFLSRAITQEELNNLKINFTPQAQFITRWNNAKELVISPAKLEDTTKYSVSIKLDKKLDYKFAFTTRAKDVNISEAVDKVLQISDDIRVSKDMNELYSKYPFLSKMPILGDKFIILFDLEKEQFRIVLKIPETSAKEEQEKVTQDAINTMRRGFLEPYKYGGYYTVFDKK